MAKPATNQALDFFQAQTCDPCCPPLARRYCFTITMLDGAGVSNVRPSLLSKLYSQFELLHVLLCAWQHVLCMQSTKTTRFPTMCQHAPSAAHTLHVVLHILDGKGAKRKKWPRSPVRSGGSRKARHVIARVGTMNDEWTDRAGAVVVQRLSFRGIGFSPRL